ncbi:MAG: hypothetical protein ACOX6E_11075 [Syntrophomonadaceae bacterium]
MVFRGGRSAWHEPFLQTYPNRWLKEASRAAHAINFRPIEKIIEKCTRIGG